MENTILHRKHRLVITTIEIIDELGIQGLSTREIARRQGISEATLFRHYKSKNELLSSVLDYYSQFDDDIFLSTRMKKLKPLDAVLFFITNLASYYENYPEITAIMQVFDVLRCEPELAEKVMTILEKRSDYFKQLVEEAKKCGDISSDLDSEVVSDMINGFFREICLKWRMNGRSFSLHERILTALHILLNALSQNKDNTDSY